MSGIVSAITRAIWVFILAGLAAVLAVAATDDPLAWRLLSMPGVAAIGAASLALGWLIRSRRTAANDPDGAPEAVPSPSKGKRTGRREPAVAAGARVDPAPAQRLATAPTAAPMRGRPTPVLTRRQAQEAGVEPPDAMPGEGEAGAPPDGIAPPPETAAPDSAALVLPPATGNERVDACFDVAGLAHRTETRRWVEIPALVEARRLRLAEDREAALTRLAEVRESFPDYDGIYLWSAEALDRSGAPEARDAMLHEGLSSARSKDALLAALGARAADEGRLSEAVRRLLQSASLQLAAGDGAAPGAFTDLADLAAPEPRLSEAADWLAAQAEASERRAPGADAETRARRAALSQNEMAPWMVEAIETLWRFYR